MKVTSLVLLSGLMWPSLVGAECAWVLWTQDVSMRNFAGQFVHQLSWSPQSSYPKDGRQQCLQDLQTLAARTAARLPGSDPDVTIEHTRSDIDDRQSVLKNFADGGFALTIFVCFPDSVNPRDK
jgi:hypothetical protein